MTQKPTRRRMDVAVVAHDSLRNPETDDVGDCQQHQKK